MIGWTISKLFSQNLDLQFSLKLREIVSSHVDANIWTRRTENGYRIVPGPFPQGLEGRELMGRNIPGIPVNSNFAYLHVSDGPIYAVRPVGAFLHHGEAASFVSGY